MSSFAAKQSYLRLIRAPIRLIPFEHIYVRDVFPSDFYAEMVHEFPAETVFPPSTLAHRLIMPAEDAGPFWLDVSKWMSGEYVADLIRKFGHARSERFGDSDPKFGFDLRLVCDDPGYSLMPHTDVPNKFLSFLFYLPSDERLRDFGTALYVPHNSDYTNTDGKWETDRSRFEKVWTAPFMPNTCFAFPRTDQSFHGVEPNACGGIRHALLLNVFVVSDHAHQ